MKNALFSGISAAKKDSDSEDEKKPEPKPAAAEINLLDFDGPGPSQPSQPPVNDLLGVSQPSTSTNMMGNDLLGQTDLLGGSQQ